MNVSKIFNLSFKSAKPSVNNYRTKPYPADIVVQFKDIYALMGQNVTLECFALGK